MMSESEAYEQIKNMINFIKKDTEIKVRKINECTEEEVKYIREIITDQKQRIDKEYSYLSLNVITFSSGSSTL